MQLNQWPLICLSLVTLLQWVSTAHSQSPASALPDDSMDLYLLIGQSNMAGRGAVSDNSASSPHIMALDAEDQWVVAKDPLHFDKPAIVGVGPGLSFALEAQRLKPNGKIGLIPCAVGGSPLSTWKPGGYHESTDTHPYDDAIRRARIAMKSGQLKGVLWHQGESDSKAGLAKRENCESQ